METPFADELKRLLIEQIGKYVGKFEGCSEEEIEEIRIAQGVDFLPNIYRQFLAIVGRADGHLFRGTDVCYPEVLENKGTAASLLYVNGNPSEMPQNSVVFSVH
jgi:hypothetical protein